MLAGCGQKQVSSSELPDVIKIGFVGALTGNAASYGQDVKAATELYFKEHPTISGKPVQVIYEDGKCNGQDAANAAQKLITIDKVQVILGGVCSGETLAFAPIANENKVAVVSPTSSSPAVTTAGDYIFRVYPSDAQVGAALVDDAVKHGYKKVALFTEQTDYAQGYRMAVKNRLVTYPDVTLVTDEAYAVDNADFRTLLAKVKEAGADVLISVSQTPVGNAFTIKQAAEMNLAIQIYGTDTMDGPDFFDIAKDAAEGVRQVAGAEDPSRSGYSEFESKMPPVQSLPIFRALAYDESGIAAQAIEAVGYNGTAIKDYWYKMPTYKGIGGDHKFNADGDNLLPAGVKVAVNGKFVLEK